MTHEKLQIHGPMEKTPEISEFQKREWPFADRDHFGKDIEWDEETFYLEGRQEDALVVISKCKTLAGVLEIDQLIVDHTKTGQGIGSEMMSFIEKLAREKGCHKLWLLTGKNWKAVDFYKKHGFYVAAEIPNHYLKDDWYYMAKELQNK